MQLDEEMAEKLIAALPIGDLPAGDPDAAALMSRRIASICTADIATVMISSDADLTRAWEGAEGYGEAWADWMAPFGRCLIELEEVREVGEKLLVLTRQTVTLKDTDSEIEGEAAAVLSFDGDKLSRAEFHLDRSTALRSAGLDPESA